MSEIKSTKNYGAFVFPTWQRPVDQRHVDAMIDRMSKESPEVSKTLPITVILIDGKEEGEAHSLLVCDGQHRKRAWQALDWPIHYILAPRGVYSADQVAKLNSHQKGWSTMDYVESFASRNKQGYVWYKSLVERYDLYHSFFNLFYSAGHIHQQFLGVEVPTNHFKGGEFDPSEEFKQAVELFCSDLDEVSQSISDKALKKRASQFYFIRAFAVLRRHPQFKLATFKQAVSQYPNMISRRDTITDVVAELVACYNYKRRHGRIDVSWSVGERKWVYS